MKLTRPLEWSVRLNKISREVKLGSKDGERGERKKTSKMEKETRKGGEKTCKRKRAIEG